MMIVFYIWFMVDHWCKESGFSDLGDLLASTPWCDYQIICLDPILWSPVLLDYTLAEDQVPMISLNAKSSYLFVHHYCFCHIFAG